jgi:hypothetical protein
MNILFYFFLFIFNKKNTNIKYDNQKLYNNTIDTPYNLNYIILLLFD